MAVLTTHLNILAISCWGMEGRVPDVKSVYTRNSWYK